MPFDPNQPFTRGDAVKPKFDPNQAFQPGSNNPATPAENQDMAKASIFDKMEDFNDKMHKQLGLKQVNGDDTNAAGSMLMGGAAGKLIDGISGSASNGLLKFLGKRGIDAAQGATTAQINGQSPVAGAVTAAGMGAVGDGINSMARGASDILMKNAAGIKRASPGVGNTLVDLGVGGTENMMSNQVNRKLTEQEAKLQGLVKGLNTGTYPNEYANSIDQMQDKFKAPVSGMTLDSVKPDLEKIQRASSQFSGPQTALSPQDVLHIKRQGDWAGYTASGTPASATDATIGRTIADKSRSVLNQISDGATGDTLKNEQALIAAKKALDKDPVTGSLGGTVAKMVPSSLAQSIAAHVSQKGVAAPAQAMTKGVGLQAILNSLMNKSTQ